MRGKETPDRYRRAQCPECGLYFHPTGLTGHLMFFHQKRFQKPEVKDPQADIDRQKIVSQLIKEAVKDTDEIGHPGEKVMNTTLQMMAMEYLLEQGHFAKPK